MENPSYIALSRQTGLMRQMETVSNNLANMNTTGYKTDRMLFHEYIEEAPGESAEPWDEELSFVMDQGQWRRTQQGEIQSTGNPLDLALEGQGYFVVDTPQGERYTRDGQFKTNPQGQLVTNQGNPVLSDQGEPIVFAPNDTDISIQKDGTVTTNNGPVGQLDVVTFENRQKLDKQAGTLFKTDRDPQAPQNTNVIQGALEGSNVEPVREMTRMIDIQRSFEAVNNVIQKEHERQQQAIQTLARKA